MDELEGDSIETKQLLERAVAGDRAAFDELFSRQRPQLRRLVELRLDAGLRGRVDASDVVQEAQLEAFRRLPEFLRRRPMPFHLWLRKTAYERLLKARRHHAGTARRAVSREVNFPEEKSTPDMTQRLAAPDTSPSQRVLRQEAARQLWQALERLGENDREIILMRNFEGLSNQEVAQVLEIEPVAASQRFGRALMRLRKLMGGGPAEEEP